MARNPNGKGGGSEKGEHERYKIEYCDLLVTHMSKGFSFSSFGADVNCGRSTLRLWLEKHPEFVEARERGHESAKKYFEKLANAKMRGETIKNENGKIVFDPKRSDTALIIFFLKTRFRDEYSEKFEIANESGGMIKIEISKEDANL